MSKLEKYWQELQRRHVVKAGLAYLAIAWVITEVATAVLPLFQIPEIFLKWLIVFLAVGFPIWLILAWVYDFSWGSIQKTEDVPFDPEVSRKKNVGLNRVIIGGLAIAVILLLVNTLRLSNKVDEIENQYMAKEFTNSLAILPFEDLSPKQDQRYFSDGLARSIYDRLAHYKDLKLISPTSSFQYRDKDVSIEVIAEELGVRYILEGSVQLFDKTYRASINLVDTQDGSTIWSKIFEDSLENVLMTYDEVSENVGIYLNVTLASEDVRRRKIDPEAYLLHLKARDTLFTWTKSGAFTADSLIRRSIEIDPTYSITHGDLSMTTLHKGLYYGGYDFDQALDIGVRAAQKAVELAPDHYYGYNWLSNWQWHARDGEASNRTLAKAQYLAPNNADAAFYSAWQAARQNRIEACLKNSERAILLDPKNPDPYLMILLSNFILGDLQRAEWALRKMSDPDDYFWYADLSYIKFQNGEQQKALEFAAKTRIDQSRLYVQSITYYSLGEIAKSDSTLSRLREVPDNEKFDLNTAFYLSAAHSYRNENDLAFKFLNEAEDYVKVHLESFFTVPEFQNLHEDPRWDAFIDRLSEEFNYDFPYRPE